MTMILDAWERAMTEGKSWGAKIAEHAMAALVGAAIASLLGAATIKSSIDELKAQITEWRRMVEWRLDKLEGSYLPPAPALKPHTTTKQG